MADGFNNRVQCFTADGDDPTGPVFVADACNGRLQAYTSDRRMLATLVTRVAGASPERRRAIGGPRVTQLRQLGMMNLKTTLRSHGIFAGEVAKHLGIGVQTLHYYEREGLIPAPGRTGSGYRLYTLELIERVAFIRKAQALGLPLTEVRELLRLIDEGTCPCGHVQHALAEKLRDVDKRIRELQGYRAELATLAERAPKLDSRGGQGRMCPIVEEAVPHRSVDMAMISRRRSRDGGDGSRGRTVP